VNRALYFLTQRALCNFSMQNNQARITIGPQRLFRFAQPRYTSFNYKILFYKLATRNRTTLFSLNFKQTKRSTYYYYPETIIVIEIYTYTTQIIDFLK